MERHNLSYEYEPMDIDLSNQSVKDMDISYNDSLTEKSFTRESSRISVPSLKDLRPCSNSQDEQPIVKKFHIIVKKPPKSNRNTIFKLISVVVIVFISIITYHVHSLNCCDRFDLEVLNETISNKLFGQSAAVELLIKTLDLKARHKLLFFSGGTGVGKTYTSSLLLDSLGSCSNVYHYTMPSFENTFSTDFMCGLTMCKISLIIVDGLTINDMDIKIQIKHVIEKSESLGKEITVILIYNCNEVLKAFDKKCDESFNSKLMDNFSEILALKRFIQFEPLSESHLKECIQQELGNRKLNDLEFEDLLKSFNVSVDGCKGVHSKMKYLNIV